MVLSPWPAVGRYGWAGAVDTVESKGETLEAPGGVWGETNENSSL